MLNALLLWGLTAVLSIGGLAVAAPRPVGAPTAKSPNFFRYVAPGDSILFIGNSYTYFNHMGLMVRALGEKRGLKTEVAQQCIPAGQLHMHVDSKDTQKRLDSQQWNFVIIQEQSDMPVVGPETMLEAGKKLCHKVRQSGGIPILYVTWAMKEAPEDAAIAHEQQEMICLSYVRLAKEGHALLAPVGPAWELCGKKYPKYALHENDRKHPTKLGSYLTACVMYRTLTGKSPVGLPGRLVTNGILLCNIPSAVALNLQKIADETCKTFSAKDILKRAEEIEKPPTNFSK